LFFSSFRVAGRVGKSGGRGDHCERIDAKDFRNADSCFRIKHGWLDAVLVDRATRHAQRLLQRSRREDRGGLSPRPPTARADLASNMMQ